MVEQIVADRQVIMRVGAAGVGAGVPAQRFGGLLQQWSQTRGTLRRYFVMSRGDALQLLADHRVLPQFRKDLPALGAAGVYFQHMCLPFHQTWFVR